MNVIIIQFTPTFTSTGLLRATDVLRTAGDTGNVLAATVSSSTSDIDARPGPVRAARRSTNDHNIISARGNGVHTGDVLHSQIGDRDTAGRGSLEIATIIVLLDENTITKRHR